VSDYGICLLRGCSSGRVKSL